MIDWHSHILPGIDDGSRNTAESISLIKMQASQGVDTVIATPHFYADDESVDSFLNRRKKAYERLKIEFPDLPVNILLGAEVKYYPGISRMENLKSLRIEGTKLLLLEMSMSTWQESTVRELIELSGRGDIKIILAHVDRYLSLQKQDIWDRIFDRDIIIQSNASFFVSRSSRRKAFSLMKNGNIQLLGSDCHNLTSRPPQIGSALDVIEKKFGKEFVFQMNKYGYSLLDH